MNKIQYKNRTSQTILDVPLIESGMEYTGVKVVNLKAGEHYTQRVNEGREVCAVLLYGYADIELAGKSYKNIGNRDTVFSDTIAYALYVSQNDSFSFYALKDASIAVCEGLGKGTYPSRLLEPNPDYAVKRGYDIMQRTAKNILPETDDADSLLIVEVITTGGNWSSFPAHRHDEDDLPNQALLEEIYYHKLSTGEEGFALQGVYNDDRSLSEGFLIQDDSAVLVRKGYHPVSVPPLVDSYYLNIMAGPVRTWVFHNEPFFSKLIK